MGDHAVTHAADIPDGVSFHGTPRFYRNALTGLQRAVDRWKLQGDLEFAIHFGDILDGFQPKVETSNPLPKLSSIR